MIKKVLILIIFSFLFFCMTACNFNDIFLPKVKKSKSENITNEEEKLEKKNLIIMEDFCLIVTVDKTNAKVGEYIETTVSFKNLSGEDVLIELTGAAVERGGELKDILQIGFWFADLEASWVEIHVGVIPVIKKIFKKDATITKKQKFLIEEQKDYIISVMVTFYIGDNSQLIWLESDKINIFVE